MTKQTKEQIQYLLVQYMTGESSGRETRELSLLLTAESDDAGWEEIMEEIFVTEPAMENYQQADWQSMIEGLIKQNTERTKESKKILRRIPAIVWRAAAIIILMLGIAAYFIFYNKTGKQTEIVKTQQERFKNDVDPGKYKARLTLADGSIIVLDTTASGELAKQGKTLVMNINGQLVYQAGSQGNGEVLYNTLSTARGETYTTVLADGSKVWLNSASSITFPTAFPGKERVVKITGEAYFEVAHRLTPGPSSPGEGGKSIPFIVNFSSPSEGSQGEGTKFGEGAVEVLGTHFNINAYDDEQDIKVTLLEGSVRVSQNGKNKMLKPGQQAQVNNEINISGNIDLGEVMAWKNGKFDFNKADIATIMRQLSRWYQIDVSYKGNVSDRFVATISRDKPVSKVLNILELTGLVHFEIDGNKVVVMP